MSETNTAKQTNAVETNGEAAATAPCKVYATKAECEAAKPTDAPKSLKVFTASKDGKVVGFVWGRGYSDTLAALARRDGYSVSLGNSKPIAKEAIAGALASMSDDERAELLKSYLPVPRRR